MSMATSSGEALESFKIKKPAICVLDADLIQDASLLDLVNRMREIKKDLRFVIIPDDEGKGDSQIKQINPDGILAKPFYLPDLVSTVADVVEKVGIQNFPQVDTVPFQRTEKKIEPVKQSSPAPEWLKDVTLAAQHLTRLSLESASQASLITRKKDIWAYAGELPQPAVKELAQTVSNYLRDDAHSDLARFIHLEATGGDYMLYATALGGEYILAMVFDAEIPFSKIRSQASSLAKSLGAESPPSVAEPAPQEKPLEVRFSEEDTRPEGDFLLDDVPPPIPGDWVPEIESRPLPASILDELMESGGSAKPSAAERGSPADMWTRQEAYQVDVDLQHEEVIDEEMLDTMPSPALKEESPSIFKDPAELETSVPPSAVADTTVSKSRRSSMSEEDDLQSVSPSMYDLTYACVLTPRFPAHYLTGELAARLSNWVSQLCIAFGWRMEHISIRPDYLQWLVNVPPTTSPGYFMRIIRQHTSQRMFLEFPSMEDENPSGDFWAPGYLIMNGKQPPPAQLVQDFIKDTRRRQGVSK